MNDINYFNKATLFNVKALIKLLNLSISISLSF
jgi:hypothetical protein